MNRLCNCFGLTKIGFHRAPLSKLFPPSINKIFHDHESNVGLLNSSYNKYRKLKLNSTMHALHGNIIGTLHNMQLLQFNKGSMFFERSLPSLENLVELHQPSICALSEANVDPNDIPSISGTTYPALSQYTVEVCKPTPGFNRGRVAALVANNVKYKRRIDLEPMGTS